MNSWLAQDHTENLISSLISLMLPLLLSSSRWIKISFVVTFSNRRGDSLEETLVLGKIEGRRGRGWRRRRRRGWDSWLASPTQWTWVWASSGSWWWTGKPGVLQSMVVQRVRHDWVTELNWTELNSLIELYVAQKVPEFSNATDGVGVLHLEHVHAPTWGESGTGL